MPSSYNDNMIFIILQLQSELGPCPLAHEQKHLAAKKQLRIDQKKRLSELSEIFQVDSNFMLKNEAKIRFAAKNLTIDMERFGVFKAKLEEASKIGEEVTPPIDQSFEEGAVAECELKEYTKLNEIESSNLKEFNIYGIIKEVTHKTTYDQIGEVQDKFRLKINDGTTGNKDISVTVFVKSGQVSANVFAEGKIARFHRLIKNSLKNNGGFYLCSQIGFLSSVLVFNIPTPGTPFKFNPSFRSSLNFNHTDKDDEILADLISKADVILDRRTKPSASSPPQTAPPIRRSPRKMPERAGTTQVPKIQPTSAVETPSPQELCTVENKENCLPRPDLHESTASSVSSITTASPETKMLKKNIDKEELRFKASALKLGSNFLEERNRELEEKLNLKKKEKNSDKHQKGK